MEKLKELGYEGKSKEWKDSVYYSFSGNTSKYNYSEDGSYLSSYETSHQINPSRIKAIWDKKFNNTNLATKEFEQRLKIIFSTCNPKALELYIKNLDKNLWEVDSMVAKIVDAEQKAKFIAFKNQRVGRVKVDDKLAMNLATYYDNKQKKYKNELEEIQLKYEREQQKLDTEFNRAQQKQSDTEFKRKSENIKKEFTKNLNEVHQQLGIKPIKYSVAIVALGFKNVDRYVDDVYLPTLNSTNQRASTTINYNGKTAQTTYTPFMVEIPNRQQFDKVFSYLLCDELYSFQRMKDTTNGFHENLNGFLKYNLAIVAYKGDSLYFFSKSNLNPVDGKLVANLQASTKNQIAAQLELMSKKSYKSDVLEDLDFHSLKVKNDKRKLKNQEI